MKFSVHWIAALGGASLFIAGCPQVPPAEFVPGQTGDSTSLGSTASVVVLSPITNLSIAGGTPVEVNWSTIATTNFAVHDIIIDVDQEPDNDNEIVVLDGIPLSQQSALISTTSLEAGTYFVGVRLFERNELAATDYAPGRLVVNQAPQLYFNSPRDNFAFDRTESVTPRFTVDWTLLDPDSTVTVQILLDPDESPDGDEFLLRTSTSQTGDSFSFDLPTANFPADTYRILALVNDGVTSTAFYAPGSIRLRARMAGAVDLRNLGLPTTPIAGAIFEGFNPRDNNGSFLSSCRDLDRDGLADFVMLAQFAKPLYSTNVQRVGVGEGYVIYGRRDRFSGTISVNSTGRLFRGDIVLGARETEEPVRPTRGLVSFTMLSDWDRDGIREMAFGLPFTDSVRENILDTDGYFRSGVAVVVSGSTFRPDFGFPGGLTVDLGRVGHYRFGISPPPPCPCPEGFYGPKAPVIAAGGTSSTCYWRHYNPNDVITYDLVGCRISSNEFGDNFAESVSSYDFDTLIMSAPDQDPVIGTLASANNGVPGAGVIYAYSCAKFRVGNFYPWTNDSTPPANATQNYVGLIANGLQDNLPHRGPWRYIISDYRLFPSTVGLQLGTFGYSVDPDDATDPCQIVQEPASPNPVSCVTYWSDVPGGRLNSAKGIDDFNADGLQDIVIGQPQGANGAGVCFIVFGRLLDLVLGSEFQLDELGRPLNSSPPFNSRIFDGLRVVGSPGERLGTSIDATGDFNGDGVIDVLIGSPLQNNRRGGACVFFGSRDLINLTEEEIAYADIPTRNLGVVFVGESEGDLAGARVTGVGDMDGDGLNDILIAAPDKSVRMDLNGDGTLDIDREGCGVVYLVYGSSKLKGTLNLADIGTEKLPGAIFVGRNSGDHLGAGIGEQGDRSTGIAGAGDVDGDGRRDLLMSSVLASPRDRVRAGETYLIYGTGD